MIREDRFVRYEQDAGSDADEYIVPQGVRYVDDLAFSGAESLSRIELPQSVDHIGSYAFRMCYALKSVGLPREVSHFGSGVFQHCWNLKRVDLPEGLESIGVDMFESCHALTSISLPRSLRSAERSAFIGCRSLRDIYIAPEQLGMLPPAARYLAAITYMEHHAGDAADGSADGPAGDTAAGLIDEFAGQRQRNLLDLAVNRRSAEAVRYMLGRGLVSEDALREYLPKSAARNRVEITALLLEHSRQSMARRDPFGPDADPDTEKNS